MSVIYKEMHVQKTHSLKPSIGQVKVPIQALWIIFGRVYMIKFIKFAIHVGDIWSAPQGLWYAYAITPEMLIQYYIPLPNRMALFIRNNSEKIKY